MNIQRIILLMFLGLVVVTQNLHAATCDTVWPADLSSNHATTLDGLTFLGGSSLSHSGGTTNFSATDYHYTTANITGGDLNATGGSSTRLFFNGSVSISGQADINFPGDPEDMVIFVNGSLTVTGQADINAVIYVTGAVSLSGQADITGAVTALGGGSQSGQAGVVYDSDAIDLVDMGQTCINSASYTAPALYYGGPACGSTNQVVVAFDNGSDKQILDNTSVTSTGNYQVSLVGGGSVTVSSVSYSSASKMATLTLGSSMGSLSQYQIVVSNIQDTDGRTISASSDTFRFYDNSGLVGEYYQNDGLSGTASVSFDSTVDKSYSPLWWFFGWRGGPWPFGSGVDEFSIRWKGWVKPSSTGSYQFQTKSDDGVRLWVDDVNGTKIIDNWTAHSQTTDTASAMSLTADTYYPIKLEYNNQKSCVWIFCGQTDGEIHLRWITPSATNQVIPSENLSTCIAPPPSNSLDHFRISHGGSGVTCEAESITIEAWGTDGSLMTDYTGGVSISTSTNNGDWLTSGAENGTLTAVGSDIGKATYTFDASDLGVAVLNLKDTHVETVNINVSDSGAVESGAYDNNLVFSDVGFRFLVNDVAIDIPNQIAGQNFTVAPNTIALQAIKTNDNTGACEEFLMNTQNIEMAYECVSPASCKLDPVKIGGVSIGDNSSGSVVDYNNINMDFGNSVQNKAEITVNYPDAGQIRLHAQLQLQDESGTDTTLMAGSSNAFWVSPEKLVVTVKSGGTDLNSVSSSATPKHKAGEVFDLVVSAVGVGGTVTSNYSPGQIQLMLTRTGPSSGGGEGDLVYSSVAPGVMATVLSPGPVFSSVIIESFNDGVSTYNAASYSEVGLFTLDIQDSNYGNGIVVPADEISVGRFTPDHFVLSASAGGYSNACSAATPFTYIGQSFGFGVSDLPEITVTPKNVAGVTVANYFGAFKKLSTTSLARSANLVSANNDEDGIAFNVTASYTLPTLKPEAVPASDAVFEYSSGDSFTYPRSEKAKVGAFTVNLPLVIDSVTDSDGITTSSSFTFTPSGSLAGDVTSQRFGRLRLENAFGPETSALIVPINAEYFDGVGFVHNTDDGCHVIAEADFDLNVTGGVDPSAGDFSGIAIGASTTTGSIGNSPFSNGTAGFSFTAPGAGSTGEIAVQVDVSGAPWLLYDWDGVDQGGDLDLLDDSPSSVATFGRYRAHDKIIYWREIGN